MIYILLPVHNRREITRCFIDCLTAQTYTNYHLVLIDDGSTDGTAEMVKNYVHALTIIHGNGNWWWAGSLQQGYKWLKSRKLQNDDIVLLTNNDTTFKDDFLDIGQTILNQHNNTLLLAQAYSVQDGRLIDTGVHVDWRQFSFKQAKLTKEINCLSTRGLFIRADDFLKLGGFHPRILPHYLSDYEFTIRAYRKGVRLLTVPSLKLWTSGEPGGYYKRGSNKAFKELKEYLSKKSMINPIYWIAFILLACPLPWKPLNVLRILKGVIGAVVRALQNCG